ncbi:hypothetical protein CGCF415_v003990 [Colletotrichum fructicola]|nr:hypothetical protein CGCF415_v003990 [Colletotrichum fructicola]KAF4939489.1 hypothetical protein CGCF245_v003572 [Colletotrichum fructicola]
MQLSKFLFMLLAADVMGQRCSSTITYCTGSICNCFPSGIAEELNKDCKAKGFDRSLGPSRTTVGNDVRCDHQCCSG